MELSDKFRGCILGGAVGDALGFVTENLSRERIRKRYKAVTEYKVRPGYGYFTDDTQLTILIAECLLEDGDFNAQKFREKLARWRMVFPRLSGRATKDAALRCLLGMKETGGNFPGSSPAMRAAPLGLYFHADEQNLFEKTVESSKVTHTHSASIAAAIAVVFGVSYLVNAKKNELDVDDFLGAIALQVSKADEKLAQEIQSLSSMVALDDDRALLELHKNSSVKGMPIRDIILSSIFAFVRTPNNFSESVLFCVNAGWDTDTMAAICGNLSGAFNGVGEIPQKWIKTLENDYKGRDYLIRLADCLEKHTPMPQRLNPVFDYACEFAHNTLFLTQMLVFKPMF